jgi:3-oxoacyl-[acyl-carrier protein] reductase
MAVPVSGPIDLKGKVAIVTGGARGIGQAVCWSLAREGAHVAVGDVLPLEETLKGLRKYKPKAIGIPCDMQKKEDIVQFVRKAIEEFKRIDILVANAGIYGGESIEEVSAEDWERVIGINLRGPFFICQQVWPIMKGQGGGKIVCIGSLAGKTGGILSGPHYGAAKGGVHAMVKWMANRGAAHGILVNGIAPGPVATPMTEGKAYTDKMVPIGRLGRPEDIAEAVVFLSSQAANFIAGTILDVNGGSYVAS